MREREEDDVSDIVTCVGLVREPDRDVRLFLYVFILYEDKKRFCITLATQN